MDSRNGVWQCTRVVVRYCNHSVRTPLPAVCPGPPCARFSVACVCLRPQFTTQASVPSSREGPGLWLICALATEVQAIPILHGI